MPPPPHSLVLPAVKSLAECANFDLTIRPFLHQFSDFPKKLFASSSLGDLGDAYTSTNPVISAFLFSLVIAQATFVVSTINKNYSQIDRLWSILPALYNLHYVFWAYLHDIKSPRLDALAAFSLCWSARLTHNYWRKGGYNKGSEDYRWAIIKKRINNEFLWVIMNIVVISLFQSVLLAAITTPSYILVLNSTLHPQLFGFDAMFMQILGTLVIIEFFSDNQQWEFHQAKAYYQKTAKVPDGWKASDLDRGFNTTGLWQYSRHPNFAAEQAIWLGIYQWGASQTGTMYNWTFVGALFYLFVFQGSTPITEAISAGKYPEYRVYQQLVGRFVPKLTGPKWADHVAEQEKKQAAGTTKAEEKKQGKKQR